MQLNIMIIIGTAILFGVLFGKIFTKIKLPQVVGFIFTGVLLGKSGFGLVNGDIIASLSPLSNIALGIIGFMVGSELEISVFKKYGKQFMYILVFESLITFLLVSLVLGFSLTLLGFSSNIAWALALMLGAISSASAPAGTTDVLWENKTKGPLTRTILGIVALDDGLGLMFFVISSSIASSLIGATSDSVFSLIVHTIFEIGVSLVFGVVLGFILMKLNKVMDGNDRKLVVSLGILIGALGLSKYLNLDMLLVAMTIGATAVNLSEKESAPIFSTITSFFPPINIMFFVLIGGTLDIKELTTISIIVVAIYSVARTIGKMLGSYLGASFGKSPFTVKRFLPFSLLSQAGVAVGLSILAGEKFDGEVGSIIVVTITASTLLIQLIGPIGVKFAVTKAKEVGLNITDEDILLAHKVKEAVASDYISIAETAPLKQVISIFGDNDSFNFPVLSDEKKLIGIITIDNLKNTLIDKDELAMFIIASDLVDDEFIEVKIDDTLFEAYNIMEKEGASFVVVTDNSGVFINILDKREIASFIKRKSLTSRNRANRLDKISVVLK